MKQAHLEIDRGSLGGIFPTSGANEVGQLVGCMLHVSPLILHLPKFCSLSCQDSGSAQPVQSGDCTASWKNLEDMCRWARPARVRATTLCKLIWPVARTHTHPGGPVGMFLSTRSVCVSF